MQIVSLQYETPCIRLLNCGRHCFSDRRPGVYRCSMVCLADGRACDSISHPHSRDRAALGWASIAQNCHCLLGFAASAVQGAVTETPTLGSLVVVSSRIAIGRRVVVATTHEPNTALSDYALRWGIETLFGCLKTRGFCLEATHLKDPERLKKLIALLTLAFCWTHRVGEWFVEHQSIPIKNHGRKARIISAKSCSTSILVRRSLFTF